MKENDAERRSYVRTGIETTDVREWRRAYKRIQRERSAQKEGRCYGPRPGLHDAHVRAFRAAPTPPIKHEAHVVRYRQILAWRIKSRRRYWAGPVKARQRRSENQQTLIDSYVVENLLASGTIDRTEITSEIIGLKRVQINLRRLSRELRRAAAEADRQQKAMTSAPIAAGLLEEIERATALDDVRRIVGTALLALLRKEINTTDVVALSKGISSISSSLNSEISLARTVTGQCVDAFHRHTEFKSRVARPNAPSFGETRGERPPLGTVRE